MRQKGFIVLPMIIMLVLIGIVGYFIYIKVKTTNSYKYTLIPSPTNKIITQSIAPSTPNSNINQSEKKLGNISGKITIKYNIPKSNEIKDELDIIIVDKDNSGTGMCDEEADDCIWLVSKTDNLRVYAYKRTYLNAGEEFIVGKQYTLEYFSRHYRDLGKLEQSGENVDFDYEKRIVKIPETGSALENFETTVDNEFYN